MQRVCCPDPVKLKLQFLRSVRLPCTRGPLREPLPVLHKCPCTCTHTHVDACVHPWIYTYMRHTHIHIHNYVVQEVKAGMRLKCSAVWTPLRAVTDMASAKASRDPLWPMKDWNRSAVLWRHDRFDMFFVIICDRSLSLELCYFHAQRPSIFITRQWLQDSLRPDRN